MSGPTGRLLDMAYNSISITVKGVPQQDDDCWEHQRELIEASGATYDRSARTWYLNLSSSADEIGNASSLAALFKASRLYGTRIHVLDPRTGMPAVPTVERGGQDPTAIARPTTAEPIDHTAMRYSVRATPTANE